MLNLSGGECCTQRNRWFSSRPSLSFQPSGCPRPPYSRKLSLEPCFSHLGGPCAFCLLWALRKEGPLWSCREPGPKATATHSTWGCTPRVPCVGLGLSVVFFYPVGSSQPHPHTQRWGQCGTMSPVSVLLETQPCRGGEGVLSPPMEPPTF